MPPWSNNQSYHALQFAKAALAKGHHIEQVFFYQDAVYHASAMVEVPSDEPALVAQWQQFHRTTKTPLVCCLGGAMRRGLVVENSSGKQNHLPMALPEFQLVA